MNDDERPIAVSPRHAVVLASELQHLVENAPQTDFVVRTIARREANDLPLMLAEMVIAGAHAREAFPAAKTYPLHFRKTYFPGRLHGDPAVEFANQNLAATLTSTPPAIGHAPNEFRSCLVPGVSYARLTPFGGDPPESNITLAQKQPLALTAGLWRLAEEAARELAALHTGGLAHGDAELHNIIISPSPLGAVLIDFEASLRRDAFDERAWDERRRLDFAPLLREAVYLQCGLGRQPGALGDAAWHALENLFTRPDRFRAAILQKANV